MEVAVVAVDECDVGLRAGNKELRLIAPVSLLYSGCGSYSSSMSSIAPAPALASLAQVC